MKKGVAMAGLYMLAAAGPAVAQDFSVAWGISFPSSTNAYNYLNSVAADEEGNVYSTGFFWGTIDLDPGTGNLIRTSSGQSDMFISKVDSNGQLIWARHIGGKGADEGKQLTLDKDGNVYVTGHFGHSSDADTVDFDPGTGEHKLVSNGNWDAFVLKLDKDGQFVWAKHIGGKQADQGYAIAVDPSGNVIVGGYFTDTADFDPGSGQYQLGRAGNNEDAFLCKLDSRGTFVWARQLGGKGASEWVTGITTDAAGNIFAAGDFSDTAEFHPVAGTHRRISAGDRDAFTARFDPAGSIEWVRTIQGDLQERATGIALDAGGNNVYVSGSFRERARFNEQNAHDTLLSFGGQDMYLASYAKDGVFRWVQQVGGSSLDEGFAVATDNKGHVYGLVWSASPLLDADPLGNGDILNVDILDMVLVKYDSAGNYNWGTNFTGKGIESGYGLAVDGLRNIYLGGTFTDDVGLDPQNTATVHLSTTTTGYDLFVAKLRPVCYDVHDSATYKGCGPYVLGDSVFSRSGAYEVVFVTPDGCDSIVYAEVTIIVVEKPVITPRGDTLGLQRAYQSYQWLKDNERIDGATDSVYVVTENDAYRVVVADENGCTDTSEVYHVTNVSVSDIGYYGSGTEIYPNPATDRVFIKTGNDVTVQLLGTDGRVLLQERNPGVIRLGQFAAGIYFLRVTDDAGRMIRLEKLVKE